jgi:hypothetical protein
MRLGRPQFRNASNDDGFRGLSFERETRQSLLLLKA